MRKTNYNKILTKGYLIQKYIKEKLSTYKISKELNIPQCTVYWYLKKYNIKTRTVSQANKGNKLSDEHKKKLSGKNHSNYKDGRTLKQYSCCEKGCENEITYQGALYGSGRCNICRRKRHSLLMAGRKQSKETIINRSKKLKGSNHWNYKGGISPLNHMIRNTLEYKEWRRKIFKRDFWTCQICGYKGRNIEAHHLIAFNEIFKNFLKEYNQFSPIEDKETLVRLAIKWKSFWDMNNGITYCCDCHNKTRGGQNAKKK